MPSHVGAAILFPKIRRTSVAQNREGCKFHNPPILGIIPHMMDIEEFLVICVNCGHRQWQHKNLSACIGKLGHYHCDCENFQPHTHYEETHEACGSNPAKPSI